MRFSYLVRSFLNILGEIAPEAQSLINTLQTMSTTAMALAWIAVGIGWFLGWFKLAIPVPSRRMRRLGHREVEWAGIAAFCIAIFSTLISLILWIIRSVGGVVTPLP